MFTYLYDRVFPAIEEIYVMIIGIANMPIESWINLLEHEYIFTEIGFFTGNSITFELGGRGLIEGFFEGLASSAWGLTNAFVFFYIPLTTPLWLGMLLAMPNIFILSLLLRWLL